MEFHEVANIFPLMDGAEYAELRDDIAANGLIEPIWVFDGKIIDGRNRYRACLDVGIEPEYRQYAGVETGLVAFVVSLNLKRRHLTASQRAVVGLDVERVLGEQARKRMLAGKRLDPGEIIPQGDMGRAAQQAADIVGTNKHYITDAKRIQEASPELLEKVRSGEVTIPQAKREINKTERIDVIAKQSTALPNNKTYPVILADPPWRYEYSISDSRQIENQYPTMSIEDICALGVGDIAAQDAILFLWATNPKLVEAMRVIEAWGFNYRTNLVWVKDRIGMGYYARQRHELLLIATRGNITTPDPENRPDSVISSPREEHSKKPDIVYQIIERMYPEYNKIELFARETREGWQCWGNQA